MATPSRPAPCSARSAKALAPPPRPPQLLPPPPRPAPRRRPVAPAPAGAGAPPSPAAAKNAADRGIDVNDVAGSGKRGQVLKGDVLGLCRQSAGRRRARSGRRPRAVPRRRRLARRAREDDQAAPDHRAPPEGSAEHRRHADDLQRSRHAAADEPAQPVQGPVREEAWREARLHGLLREGLHAMR